MGTERSKDAGPQWEPIIQNAESADITTKLTVATAVASRRIIADDLWITSAVAQTISVRNTTTNTVIVKLDVTAGMLLPLTLRNSINAQVDGEGLEIIGTAAGNVKAHCSFHLKA